MRDDGSRPDLAAAHTRADERVRQALRSAERTRDGRRERTYLLCAEAGRPAAPRPRR